MQEGPQLNAGRRPLHQALCDEDLVDTRHKTGRLSTASESASSALPGGKFYPGAHAGCDRSMEEAPCSDWGISAGSLLDG